MKMSEIFHLPLELRKDLVHFSKSDTCYFKVESVKSRDEELQVTYCIHQAINDHDQLTEENSKLREVLKNLTESASVNEEQLNDLLMSGDYGESKELCDAKQLLNQLKDQNK